MAEIIREPQDSAGARRGPHRAPGQGWQVVARPAGPQCGGQTPDDQITGAAEHGGLQVLVHPMMREVFEARFPPAPRRGPGMDMVVGRAEQYRKHNLPWFDYYADGQTALGGGAALKNLRSIIQIARQQGDVPLPANSDIPALQDVVLGERPKNQVRDGRF
jgi:hypothetical protein